MPINVPNYNRKTDRHQFGTLIGIPRNPHDGEFQCLIAGVQVQVVELVVLPNRVNHLWNQQFRRHHRVRLLDGTHEIAGPAALQHDF